jgi:tagatose-1,6-bisphosphate aldolase
MAMAQPMASELATLDLEVAADQAIAACAGDAREALKALIVANGFLEAQVEDLRASISAGYSRGRFDVPRD